MFASWCESDYTPSRRRSLREMCAHDTTHDLRNILPDPPQGPLDFAILFSGFPGNSEYYRGFYEPKITTPTIHALAAWDIMIPRTKSIELVNSCCNPSVIEHRGMHHVPRDPITIGKIIASVISLRSLPRSAWLHSSYVDGMTIPPLERCWSSQKIITMTLPLVDYNPLFLSQAWANGKLKSIEQGERVTGSDHFSRGSSRPNRRHFRRVARRYQLAKT